MTSDAVNRRKRDDVAGRELSPGQAAAAAMVAEARQRGRGLELTGKGAARWIMRWKPVINAFAITFGDRWPVAETY
jgi:putative transposase